MSVLLPKNGAWLVSGWISRGFFEDALPFVPSPSKLRSDIQFCIDADVDALDLQNADLAGLRVFRDVVQRVLQHNDKEHGKNFVHPEAFPLYRDKLVWLGTIVDDLLETLNRT